MAAKKTTGTKRVVVTGKTAKVVTETVSTPVRYSALPKLAPAAKPTLKLAITADQIAVKAYELFAAGTPGGQLDHWLAAEAELKIAA